MDLHTIPLFHANGWGHPQSSTMLGLKQVMVRRFEPSSVLHMIADQRATDMCLVPTMANALLNCAGSQRSTTTRVCGKVMMGGAASCPELIATDGSSVPVQVLAGLWPHRDRAGGHHGRDKSTLLNQPESERHAASCDGGLAVTRRGDPGRGSGDERCAAR